MATASRARRWAAAASLLSMPALLTGRMMHHGAGLNRYQMCFCATYLLGGACLTRPSPLAQAIGQGIALNLLLVQGWVLWTRVIGGDVGLVGVLLVGAPALALSIAFPLLVTGPARAAFAPRASRTWFLGGAIASVAAAAHAAPIAVNTWSSGRHFLGGAAAMLVAALAAQAVGVLRMRAWGVALGAVTAVAVLCTALVGVANPTFAVVTSLPGLALVTAVGAAWLATKRERA